MVNKESYKNVSNMIYAEGKSVESIMSKYPTENERRLKHILDDHHIKYSFQKLLFKYAFHSREYFEGYYVAQFWLHKKKLFIEIEPGYRLVKPKCTSFKVDNVLEAFPKAQCISLTKDDLDAPEFIEELLKIVK